MSRPRGRPLGVAAMAMALAFAAAGCGASNPSPTPSPIPTAEPTPLHDLPEITIYAAASLRDVMTEIETMYEGATGARLTISTDSSAALRTQIEQGAPADVFLSADTTNPQMLVDAGLAEGRVVAFAGNLLVIIVPAANPAAIQSPVDLATPGLKIIAAGGEVPITRYAAELVANLAAEPNYPADFAAAYAANVVSREDNVRSVVAKIEIGEGDAGIVYATDANASSDVATITVPESANVPATYAGVVVRASPRATFAAVFLEWLAGPDGGAILRDFGFTELVP